MLTREKAIAEARRRIVDEGFPRLLIAGVMLLTGLVGFLTSYLLLHTGVTAMWIRYPIAILVAYGAFLCCLRIWLWFHGRELGIDVIDGIDVVPDSFGSTAGSTPQPAFGGGGDFAGAGASDSWAGAHVQQGFASPAPQPSGGGGSSWGIDLDLDDAWAVVLIAAALLLAAIAAFYVIYIAPVLLAEILVDGVLVASLYKKLKKTERRYWLWTAVRKTWMPVVAVMAVFAVVGYVLQLGFPEARTMGDVWRGDPTEQVR